MRLNRVAWITVVAATGLGVGVVHATPEGNPKNGLSNTAFRENSLTVNPTSVNTLLTHKLSDVFTVPDFALQMHDPAAQAVLTEIVRCALSSSVGITFHDPIDQTTHTFMGELGICEGQTAWPSLACQQLVTACVASRVNALQEAIPISIRGIAGVDLEAAVSPETSLREHFGNADPVVGVPIFAFSACTPGLGVDCGWQPAYVGTCTARQQVTITISDPTRCTTPVRVCGGIHGCAAGSQESYSPFVMEEPSACATDPVPNQVSFWCPPSLDYSVMVQTNAPVPPVVATSTDGVYPANVGEVFNFREGAFFGNMFANTGNLLENCAVPATDPAHPTCFPTNPCPVTSGCTGSLPYPNVYACYTEGVGYDGDTRGAEYMNDRICDNPSANAHCFAHQPLRCYYGDPTTNQTHGSHCKWDGSVFSGCHGADNIDSRIYPPVTTYLNDRCDVINDRTICYVKPSKQVTDAAGDADDDQGGCSATSSAGGAWIVVLGFVVARRRRQRS